MAGVSRAIQDDEITECTDTGRTPLTFRVGTDAIAIVTNPNNDFVSDLTLEELATLFTATNWSNVNPTWPAEPIQRFIPPTDSSVVDLFVERVMNNEADQLLLAPSLIPVTERGKQAQGITINPYALGFMEYPAYQRNAGLLNLVAVNGIVPDDVTIEDESYPLLRPLLLYSDATTLAEKPQVAAFINFYLTNVQVAMEPLNYVPANAQDLDNARTTLRQAVNTAQEPQ
jgi:phosphate transport system substrate-binding protein